MITGITTDLTIVGIDPGTTAAAAVLDPDGNLLGSKSAKNFSKDELIRFIISHGKPLVIAADVANSPSFVETVASNLGAELWVPDDDLPAGQKEDLADAFDVSTTDTHTMDAVAAAEYARREYKDKLDSIRHRAEDADLPGDAVDDVIELVVKGSLSTNAAINEVEKSRRSDDTDADKDTERANQRNWERIARDRQDEIDRLKEKVQNLEEYNEQLEEQVAEQDEAAGSEPMEEELRKRNREINRLRDRVAEQDAKLDRITAEHERLEAALDRIKQDDWIHVPVVSSLSDVAADIVYCDASDGASGTVSDTIDVVLTTEALAETQPYQRLRDRGIRVVSIGTFDKHIELADGYIVDEAELEDAIDGETERFAEWLEDYRKRQTS